MLSKFGEKCTLDSATKELIEALSLAEKLSEQDKTILMDILTARRNRELCAKNGCPATFDSWESYCHRCGETF